MRLGIDCRDLIAGSRTGIGRFVENLLLALALEDNPPELFLYGNQRTVFRVRDAGGRPRTHTRQAAESATWWWDRVTLPRLARRDSLDVFLSPYFKAPGIRSAPVAITIHDLLFLRTPPELSGRSAVYCRAFRSLAAGFARRAAAILTVSEFSRRDIIELLDVPESKTHVVGNCVGPEYQPLTDPARIAAAKQAFGLAGDYILYVGNFGPHKNIGRLVETYAALDAGLRARLTLVLAGRADKWAPSVRDTARRLGVLDKVRLTGHVTEEHLPALYSGAAAFATLSLWEGFGLPAAEAMACGAPVLCSNRGALPEVTSGAALLVDPGELDECVRGLTRLLTDEALRAELRSKGLLRAAQFSPARFARLVLTALEAAVAVGGGARHEAAPAPTGAA